MYFKFLDKSGLRYLSRDGANFWKGITNVEGMGRVKSLIALYDANEGKS